MTSRSDADAFAQTLLLTAFAAIFFFIFVFFFFPGPLLFVSRAAWRAGTIVCVTALLAGLWLRRPTLATGIAAAVLIVCLNVKARYEESLLFAAYPDYAAYRPRT